MNAQRLQLELDAAVAIGKLGGDDCDATMGASGPGLALPHCWGHPALSYRITPAGAAIKTRLRVRSWDRSQSAADSHACCL
jgi:hypothetical protein